MKNFILFCLNFIAVTILLLFCYRSCGATDFLLLCIKQSQHSLLKQNRWVGQLARVTQPELEGFTAALATSETSMHVIKDGEKVLERTGYPRRVDLHLTLSSWDKDWSPGQRPPALQFLWPARTKRKFIRPQSPFSELKNERSWGNAL